MSPKRAKDDQVRLIPAGRPGRLISGGGEHMPVRVFERGSDVLMLVTLLSADTGVEPEPLEPALLEYSSAQGLVRLRGEATLEQNDLIRFRPEQPAEVLQRREFVRIDSPQPVTVDGSVRTHAVDISGGGMLLRGLEDLIEGQRVRFRLELGGSEPPIQGGALIVRAGEDGRRGLVFDAITAKERQRLIHFIFEKQRIAINRTRDGAGKRRRTA
ncbi:MAG TPA: PilZ domain-containing protein [Solirubrobacteraceae bacterium]|nr:PilZ domain-containing protein [Solirubrobacteraceae bacterium]